MLNYEFPPVGGGASIVTYNLSKELVKLGVDVDVVTMGYKGLPKFEHIDGIRVFRVPCIRKRKEICHAHEMLTYNISAFFFILKLMRKNKYDLNHTHFIIPTGALSYLLKKLKGLPYIITIHGSDVPNYNPDRFSHIHTVLQPAWKRIVQNADGVIPLSNSLKELLLQKIEIDNITIIPNGFDQTLFNPKEKEKKILLVSRIFERKGFQYFLEAIRGLDLDYEINIVGEGPYKENLIHKASSLNEKVNFLGWVDTAALHDLYAISSIFVFPSTAENFPMVLLEAMASKMAIITTNSTGCPEVVGDSALLVRPKNAHDIRDALLKLQDNDMLREELGNKARQRLEDNFTLEEVTQHYLQLYKEVC